MPDFNCVGLKIRGITDDEALDLGLVLLEEGGEVAARVAWSVESQIVPELGISDDQLVPLLVDAKTLTDMVRQKQKVIMDVLVLT